MSRPAATPVHTCSEADAAVPPESEGTAVPTGAAGPLPLFDLADRTSGGVREFGPCGEPDTN